MKQILEQYAKAVIASFIAITIIVSFYSVSLYERQGIPAVLGVMVEEVLSLEKVKVKTGNTFDTYMDRIPPTISVKNAYALKAGQPVLVSELFSAMDSDGRTLSVQMQKAWKENGEDVSMAIMEDGSFCITESGIVWVMARAEDAYGYHREIIVKLLVNER